MFERPPFVTIILLVLCSLGFALTLLGHTAFLYSMLFQPVVLMPVGLSFDSVWNGVIDGQLWRPLSPIFIHFGWFHITFNALALWYLGRAIELRYGSMTLMLATVLLALVSNSCQYAANGPHLFGGFSGVNFGFYGIALAHVLNRASLDIPRSLHIIMPLFFLLGLMPFKSLWGFADVANHAHVSGLLLGLLLGAALHQYRLRKGNHP